MVNPDVRHGRAMGLDVVDSDRERCLHVECGDSVGVGLDVVP